MNVFIFTQGCSANQSDSEVMAGILETDGFHIVTTPEAADILILNTCTVKSPTEGKAFSLLKKWKQEYKNKTIIVAGCIPQSDPKKLAAYPLLGTRQVHRITELVQSALEGRIEHFIEMEKTPRLHLQKIRKNPVIEIIPISAGCLGSCAFCKTKLARGNLYSYAPEDIITQVTQAVQDGVKEIWLTSQDTGAYGRDLGSNLPKLLREVIKVKEDFLVRLGMMNPDLAQKFLPELLDLMRDEKIFKFLHIPVQSGNDRILKSMKRLYSAKDFENIVARARREIPNITIATDIIVGFPGETEEEFQDTFALLERLRIPVVNISKFYPRSGTLAAKMKKIPTHLVKARSTKLAVLQKKMHLNDSWMGWEGQVIVDENRGTSSTGRNAWYKPVVLRGEIPLGRKVLVKITAVTPIDLRGRLL